MEEKLAPVVLFVYNRLEHVKRTIEALQKNILADKSELFIYSDAPKKDDDVIKVNSVRQYIHQVKGFKQVIIRERENNYGLAKSIVEGVGEIVSQYGKIIVLEDDLVTDVKFLTYMNEGLNRYRKSLQVFSVTGYSFLKKGLDSGEAYFLEICSSWSWGTWKDRWQKFDLACEGWEVLKRDWHLRKKFDYDYSYPYYYLLQRQMEDYRTNSWAIKWYWTIFKNEGLTLYPPESLVKNEGFDGSGEHCGKDKVNHGEILNDCQRRWKYNDFIHEQKTMRKQVAYAIWKQTGLMGRMQILKDILL